MKSVVIAGALCALCACADATAPISPSAGMSLTSAANAAQSETIPSALVVVNPCNGDVVTLTGETHTVSHSVNGPRGQLHQMMMTDSHYSGTGVPSGDKYQGSSHNMDSFFIGAPFPFIETVHSDLRLVSSGKDANFTIGFDSHITVNANGDVTDRKIDHTTTCNG